MRRSAAWALGQTGRPGAPTRFSAISDSDVEVKEMAIWSLGQLDLPRAPATLIDALNDNSPGIREITAWTLGQIGDTAAVRALARAFETESNNTVKKAYLWSLTQIGTAPTSVIEAAMKSNDPELRRHAVRCSRATAARGLALAVARRVRPRNGCHPGAQAKIAGLRSAVLSLRSRHKNHMSCLKC